MDDVLVAEKIRNLRIQNNLSQYDLAKKIGVSQTAVNLWEHGKRKPKINQLQQICHEFNLPLSDFVSVSEGTEAFMVLAKDFVSQINPDRISTGIVDATDFLKTMRQLRMRDDFDEQEFLESSKLLSKYSDFGLSQNKKQLLIALEKLNALGQHKAREQIELLTKIPEYQATPEPPTPSPAAESGEPPEE